MEYTVSDGELLSELQHKLSGLELEEDGSFQHEEERIYGGASNFFPLDINPNEVDYHSTTYGALSFEMDGASS